MTEGVGVERVDQVRVATPSRLVLVLATAALVVLTSGATVFLALTGTGDLARSTPALEPLPPASPRSQAPVVLLRESAIGTAAAVEASPSRRSRSRSAANVTEPTPQVVAAPTTAAPLERPRGPRPPAERPDGRPDTSAQPSRTPDAKDVDERDRDRDRERADDRDDDRDRDRDDRRKDDRERDEREDDD